MVVSAETLQLELEKAAAEGALNTPRSNGESTNAPPPVAANSNVTPTTSTTPTPPATDSNHSSASGQPATFSSSNITFSSSNISSGNLHAVGNNSEGSVVRFTLLATNNNSL